MGCGGVEFGEARRDGRRSAGVGGVELRREDGVARLLSGANSRVSAALELPEPFLGIALATSTPDIELRVMRVQ